MGWQSFLVTALFAALAANVYAGIMYLEVPENITAEMVRNPSAENEAAIEDFLPI